MSRPIPPRRGKHPSADPILPVFNTGGVWDVSTGDYVEGPHGEMILMGGMSYTTGISGPGNTFKSVGLWDMLLSVLDNYPVSQGGHYCTELSTKASRPQRLSQFKFRLKKLASSIIYDAKVNPGGQLQMQSMKDTLLDAWWNLFVDQMEEKFKLGQKEKTAKEPDYLLTMPVKLPDGTLLRSMVPDIFGVDSFSTATTSGIEGMQEEFEIGHKKRTTEFLRGGIPKTQMMLEMPVQCARGGGMIILVAHLGKEFMQDPNVPPQKQLAFLKAGMKFKGVPEKFNFMVNNCWLFMSASPYWNNGTDRIPMYPRDSGDKTKDDTDLMTVNVANLRGKSGGSGMPFAAVVSQSEGMKNGLTMLDFCKKWGRYGMDDNVQNYFLHLRPDEKLSRTTVRGKFEENERLYNAMKITWELAFTHFLKHEEDEKWREPTPQQIYDKLKADGYDWDILLDTTPCWSFIEFPSEKPYLSTRDIQRMYHGEYHPYWLGEDKKTVTWPFVEKKKGK